MLTRAITRPARAAARCRAVTIVRGSSGAGLRWPQRDGRRLRDRGPAGSRAPQAGAPVPELCSRSRGAHADRPPPARAPRAAGPRRRSDHQRAATEYRDVANEHRQRPGRVARGREEHDRAVAEEVVGLREGRDRRVRGRPCMSRGPTLHPAGLYAPEGSPPSRHVGARMASHSTALTTKRALESVRGALRCGPDGGGRARPIAHPPAE